MRKHGSWNKRMVDKLACEWDWKCPYCGNDFGVSYSKGGIWQGWLRPTLEHIVPVAYGGGNDIDNLLAICQVCNAMKTDKMFKSFTALISYIEKAWKEKKLEVDGDVFDVEFK